jgi:hypothetical protein
VWCRINCTLQDAAASLGLLESGDLGALRHRSGLVDVSFDPGMGFDWARPTSFRTPSPGLLPGPWFADARAEVTTPGPPVFRRRR